MELKFLGRGSAFNYKEGNNSAYFIDNNELFLIDCGEDVFYSIMNINILDKVDKINLMITHTHSDHVGSLGTFIMYTYFNLHIEFNIILPSKSDYRNSIISLLRIYGCTDEMYNIKDEFDYFNKYSLFKDISYLMTNHYPNMLCYGILFNTEYGLIYYSGDTRDDRTIKEVLSMKDKIDKMYIDVTSQDFLGNVHLYIGYLDKVIPDELRNKVYCMHVNDDKCIKMALDMGFNVVNKC